MTLQEAKEQAAKENEYFGWSNLFGANTKIFNRAVELYANSKLQEKQAEIAELEKKYQNVSSWNVDALKQINEHKAEIQKLHDHYQKQIGEWEERLKWAEQIIECAFTAQEINNMKTERSRGNLESWQEQLLAVIEKYESLKNQTPAPK